METFAVIFGLVLLSIMAASTASCVGVLRRWYKKAQEKKCDAVFNHDPNVKTTTKLPIPVFAADCRHAWTVVDKAVLDMTHEQKYVMTMKCDFCGVIDKTIEVTSKMPPPVPPVPAPPCSHEWETVERTKLGSENEFKLVLVQKCPKCGSIDKTIEAVKIPLPPVPPEPKPPKSECRHKWEVEKSIALDSAYEQMAKAKAKVKANSRTKTDDKSDDVLLEDPQKWMFRKTLISIRVCSTCGEVDKTVASNFDSEGTEPEE